MHQAAHVAMLIMGRLLVGYAVGTIVSHLLPSITEARLTFVVKTGVAPVFGAEIAKTHERARVTALNQMAVAWGFCKSVSIHTSSLPDTGPVVANWTGYGSKFMKHTGQWRVGFAIQAMPAFALAVGVFFIPESPRCVEAL